MLTEIHGWDTPNTAWVKLLVDSLGHLQVDVLSSELPDGAATLAKQTDQLTKLNSIITKLAGGLPAALDTLALKVREQGTPQQNCYGWVGDVWYHLLVESAANPNLRVKLYDGATGLATATPSAGPGATDKTLATIAVIKARYIDTAAPIYLVADAPKDNIGLQVGLFTCCYLFGYSGTTVDRLRTYGTGILKVGRAPIGATVVRVTGTGAVVGTAAHIFWISCTPESTGSEWEISDDEDGSTTEVMCHFDSDKHSEVLHFDPPQEFSTGIYVKKFDKVKCLHICYGT